ncbi:hypothetical protein [Corynebacterium diphtheriae]|uniref:hypothetical protein n=1 Tax=Corynebacterium diphtheriae TaxID=1717 RepID=UPI001F4ECFAF|nr:hypothetical protein [Corynebacterium diphtheriae]
MSISRHLDQYLSERGLVQRAEVVPEDGCQEFLPADRWFGDMPEGEMVENDTPQKYFFRRKYWRCYRSGAVDNRGPFSQLERFVGKTLPSR